MLALLLNLVPSHQSILVSCYNSGADSLETIETSKIIDAQILKYGNL